MTSINIHLLLLFSSLFTLSFSNFPPFSCQLNSTQSEHPDHRIIFYHTRKCGGWTIHNYFTKILKAQFGNTCQLNKGQIVDKTDWRCEMGYVQGGTSPSQQCLALNKFYESSYQFSQVEHPLLRQHIFPSFVTTMTVLRHPIERVISSYRMIRNTFLNEPDWNMKDWLLHSHMLPLNQTPPSQPNANDTRRLWNSKKISGSTKKPFPRKPVNGDSSPKPPTSHPGAAPSPSPSPAPTRIKMSFPRLPSVRTLPTDGLDENYMTKWLCGRWTQLSPATEECFQRALANLHQFDFVFLTESLSSDLPLSAKLLGINITQSHKQVTPYNIRMHDPQLESSHDLNHATNITDLSSIPEFSKDDGTYEIAVKMNQYDFKLYRHAIFRNCVTLKKNRTVQDCKQFSTSVLLKARRS